MKKIDAEVYSYPTGHPMKRNFEKAQHPDKILLSNNIIVKKEENWCTFTLLVETQPETRWVKFSFKPNLIEEFDYNRMIPPKYTSDILYNETNDYKNHWDQENSRSLVFWAQVLEDQKLHFFLGYHEYYKEEDDYYPQDVYIPLVEVRMPDGTSFRMELQSF